MKHSSERPLWPDASAVDPEVERAEQWFKMNKRHMSPFVHNDLRKEHILYARVVRGLTVTDIVMLSSAERKRLRLEVHEARAAALEIELAELKLWEGKLSRRSRQPEPPSGAEFLLGLLSKSTYREAVIGDLAEQFNKNCRIYGAVRARRFYWIDVLRSLWPLAKRALSRLTWWVAVVSAIRRLFVS